MLMSHTINCRFWVISYHYIPFPFYILKGELYKAHILVNFIT